MLESRLVKLVVGCSFFWAGCGKPGELAVTPETIDWGEVDFQGWPSDMDEGGYQQTEVAITNHPLAVSPGYAAVASKSKELSYQDHGMNWEISGKNGFFAPFSYQGG